MGEQTVTDVSFHMHSHGQRARVRLVRDGVELQPLADIVFDVASTAVATNRKVLPGDALILECHYDNDLDTNLKFGDGLTDEM